MSISNLYLSTAEGPSLGLLALVNFQRAQLVSFERAPTLDHFKHINDALGHAAGDEALRHFANVAQSILPNSCEIGRWGGEEFLVLMPGTSASVAADLIDRLRATLKDRGHIPMILAEVDLTFSAGLAVGSMGNPDQILEIADRALYQAKATGRNRTVTMTPDDRGPTKLIPITVAT